jgi:small subunit ribosomal protein S4
MLKGTRCRSDKCPMDRKRAAPGKDPKARLGKRSDHGVQLREKQKLKKIYGMLEKQFRLFFERSVRMPGVTGENLFVLLERRLDNVVYRLRFASSRSQARQLVSHGHILVNGRKINIPSYLVKVNDEVSLAEASRGISLVKDALKEFGRSGVMPWLSLDPDEMKGKFLAAPRRGEITDLGDIKEQMIIEHYSK